jgi:hypothetical protein
MTMRLIRKIVEKAGVGGKVKEITPRVCTVETRSRCTISGHRSVSVHCR